MWHVVGAGPLGSLFAARLARAGSSRVRLVLREPTWAAVGRPARATLQVQDGYTGGEGQRWSAEVDMEPVEAEGPIRNAVVATKAGDARDAVARLRGRFSDDAVVLLLSNGGMGVHEELMADDRVRNLSYLLGCTTHGAYATRDRLSIVHAGLGQTWVGAAPGSTVPRERLYELAASLDEAGLRVSVEERIAGALWRKLSANAALNGLTALLDCRNGEIVGRRHGRELMEALCREVACVMRAEALDADGLAEYAAGVARDTAANFSSMHQDVAAGRPTEVPYINGYVARAAERNGLAAPVNEAVCHLVRLKEQIQASKKPRGGRGGASAARPN